MRSCYVTIIRLTAHHSTHPSSSVPLLRRADTAWRTGRSGHSPPHCLRHNTYIHTYIHRKTENISTRLSILIPWKCIDKTHTHTHTYTYTHTYLQVQTYIHTYIASTTYRTAQPRWPSRWVRGFWRRYTGRAAFHPAWWSGDVPVLEHGQHRAEYFLLESPARESLGRSEICVCTRLYSTMHEWILVCMVYMHACMYVCMNDHNLLHTFIYRHPYTWENSPGRQTSLRCRLGRHRALPLRRRSMTVCTRGGTKKYYHLVVLCLMEMSTHLAI
jgi:hypothetical protein